MHKTNRECKKTRFYIFVVKVKLENANRLHDKTKVARQLPSYA